jgi:hypothetical protein
MIAYDCCQMPTQLKIKKADKDKAEQQIHIYGSYTLNSDGRLITLFRGDKHMLENAKLVSTETRSTCN